MALRLRRGTDIERLQITPESGELIFVTDQELLYIGDGTTPGGIIVSGGGTGLSSLVDDLSPQLGGDLELNTWNITGPGAIGATGSPVSAVHATTINIDTLTNETQPEITLGSNLNLGTNNIVGTGDITIDGSLTVTGNIDFSGVTITLDQLTNVEVGSAAEGNVLAYDAALELWTPVAVDGTGVVGGSSYNIGLTANDTSVLVDPATKTHYGNFYGSLYSEDGTLIVDTNAGFESFNGNVFGSVIGDDSTILVDKSTGAHTGDFYGDLFGSVIGDDSTILVDKSTGVFRGALSGTVDGDITGSVFGDDSTLFFDAVANTMSVDSGTVSRLSVDFMSSGAGQIVLNDDGGPTTLVIEKTSINPVLSAITISSNENFIELNTSNGSIESPTPVTTGNGISGVLMNGLDTNEAFVRSIAIAGFVDPDGVVAAGHVSGKLIFVNANSTGTGDVSASFNSSGTFEAPVLQTGTYADAAVRDTFVTAPSAGMIVFLTDSDGSGNPGFQGYNGTAWVSFS
jgi:hypothetical protein